MNKTPFSNPGEIFEWTLITHEIIKAFEDRGYGLYQLGKGPMNFTSITMIMEFVQFGRAEEVLELGFRYLPLPLLEDSTDAFQMGKAIGEMTAQLRGPFFTNCLINKDGVPEKVSSHLIDSISVESPFLNLHCDVRFCQVTTENMIEIHLSKAAAVIRKQLMMSLRQVLITNKEKTNALL